MSLYCQQNDESTVFPQIMVHAPIYETTILQLGLILLTNVAILRLINYFFLKKCIDYDFCTASRSHFAKIIIFN